MPTKISRRLVIDASIAHASGGEEATFPTSKNCRDFLIAVRTICHRIVMTTAIIEEWNNHQSNFTRRWRVSMEARKKVNRLNAPINKKLRDKIKEIATNEKAREAMFKDIHLVEAAKATDQIVVALDETVRDLFASISRSIGEMRNIVWVNPDKTEEQPISWLENGAKPEKRRMLGLGGKSK
ncbi:hypothetical protein L0337_04275 [candidate division KSB1 bacterium]|nr:hypothetical protein [candidate division KSB1 bacterium]